MVSLNIKFDKKDLWLVSAIFIFLVGVGFVVAWDSNNPILHGHTANEIEGGVGGGNLQCTEYLNRPSGETGDQYCNSINEECIGIWDSGMGSFSDECSVVPTYDHITKCCSGGGGGSGGSCGLKELPKYDCRGPTNFDCRARILLQDAIDEGYTGACYYKQDNNQAMVAASLVTSHGSTTQGLDNTYLYCVRADVVGTDELVVEETSTAYYRYCS